MANSVFDRCECHEDEYPAFIGEIHGLSKALSSKSPKLKIFWWFLLLTCAICGTASTVLIFIEHINGASATSTTIRLVSSLELPAITICPKSPDMFHFGKIFNDVKTHFPNITTQSAVDLFRFWLGGSGLENFTPLVNFNKTYIDKLGNWYRKWSEGYDHREFFNLIQEKYGYDCSDFFYSCEIGGRVKRCCKDVFFEQAVMKRGRCFQTIRNFNQTESDYIGRLVIKLKNLSSITSPEYNFSQTQITVYINDNFDHVLDFPRYYLYKDAWNQLRFTARFIELLDHPEDCSQKIFGKDAVCVVKNWVMAKFVRPYDCVVPYFNKIPELFEYPVCDPTVIVNDYYKTVVARSDFLNETTCIPGCQRLEYDVTLQQTWALAPFTKFAFNLEASFYDLQYEHVKEVSTSSIPGFMSQIGGQFGFFLGFSIITLVQFFVYLVTSIIQFIYRISEPPKLQLENRVVVDECDCQPNNYPPFIGEIHGLSQALLSKTLKLRIFWSTVLLFSVICGIGTTGLVFVEYFRGHTITSTTIKLVPSLEFPSITICSKNPEYFDFNRMFDDIKTLFPNIPDKITTDLIILWLGGNGLGNVKPVEHFTETYIDELNVWYENWSKGYDNKNFFDLIKNKYALSCADFFNYCELGGNVMDCCKEIFKEQPVMRRGLCYQTRRNINQTKLTDLGKLSIRINSFSNNISLQYGDPTPQLLVYINDKGGDIIDFTRFFFQFPTLQNFIYIPKKLTKKIGTKIFIEKCIIKYAAPCTSLTLFKDEWNGLYLTTRLVELFKRSGECTTEIIGKDEACFVRNWMTANLITPYNCTFPYLNNVFGMPELPICDPIVIAKNYHKTVEVIHAGTLLTTDCLPGCKSWETDFSVQQTLALEPFINYTFQLEVSYYALQYEHVKEVLVTSFPGFMSQIGGQFGFFLGFSFITMLQLIIHGVNVTFRFFYTACRPQKIVPQKDFALTTISNGNHIKEDKKLVNRKSHSL